MPREPFSIFSKPSASRAGGAVVVDVVDGDAGEADLVDRALAARGIAIAVPDRDLLHLVVRDAGVLEGLGPRLPRHVRVVPIPRSRLLELRHPDADQAWKAGQAGRAFPPAAANT
jgi:hypothetical protein